MVHARGWHSSVIKNKWMCHTVSGRRRPPPPPPPPPPHHHHQKKRMDIIGKDHYVILS